MSDYSATPGTLNITILQGDTMSIPLTIGGRWETYTWSASLRPGYDISPSVTITTSGLSYTTSGDTTALTLSLTSSSSSALTAGSYVWDLQYQTGATVRTFLMGDFTVVRDVT